MSNHTKGPWHVVLSNNATAHVRHENCHDVSDIGDLAGRICVMPAEIAHSYNSLANARLIAAAPELLDALTELTEMVERQADFNDDRDGMAISRARSALTKATGEKA